MTFTPPCVVCGRACIPLGDYEMPVCIGCDDAVAVIGEASLAIPPAPLPTEPNPLHQAAAAEAARIYGAFCREHRQDPTDTAPDHVIAARRAVAESMHHLHVISEAGAA